MIKEIDKGERTVPKQDFLIRLEEIKLILDNKKQYKKEYDLLQGKWISKTDASSVMEIDGLVSANYYTDEFVDQSKIKIEDKYLYITTDNFTDKYEIMNLTDDVMKLLFLPAGKILIYEKKK